MIGTT